MSRTYKNFDGYAPMMAYIGTEGYGLNFELREGSQHCQNVTPDFLRETISAAKQLTNKSLLFRMDSGNDAAPNMEILHWDDKKSNFSSSIISDVRTGMLLPTNFAGSAKIFKSKGKVKLYI